MSQQKKIDKRTLRDRKLLVVQIPVLLGSLVLSIAWSSFAIAQEPSKWETRVSDPIFLSWLRNDEISSCVGCHLSPPVGKLLSGKNDPFGTFSRRIEMEKWLTMDKHTIARRRVEPFDYNMAKQQLEVLFAQLDTQQTDAIEKLTDAGIQIDRANVNIVKGGTRSWIGASNVLSRRICDKLWGEGNVTTPEGYALFRDNCLTCHGGYESGKTGFEFAQVADAQLGIDCNYCHQIGQNDNWVDVHDSKDKNKWRMKSPAEKESQGMRDLVNTANQASLCFDCHVGNRDKNMFVTHQMYAAGHPPIPSIELQEFCKEMPQHWQTPSQLHESLADFKGRKQYFATNYPGLLDSFDADEIYWNTRKMLVGALAARKKTLELVIDSADSHRWADYSLYDCAACHHELDSNSYRQLRGFPGAPGRPRQHEWPSALLSIAYKFYGPQTRSVARQLETELKTVIAAKPFGDPNQVRPVAEQLGQQVEIAIAEIQKKVVDARIAKIVLKQLAMTPESEMLTYDSARQVVWAMQTIVNELQANNAAIDPRVVAEVKSLGDPEATGIEAVIPAGRAAFIFPESLESDLKRRADFRPTQLAAKLRQIGQMVVVTNTPKQTDEPPALVSQRSP